MRLAGGIAISLGNALTQKTKHFLLVHLALVTHDDSASAIMRTLQHELIWEFVEVDILHAIPHAIALRENILESEALNMLAHLILVSVFRPF